ncbi:uncharacterized protein Aven [Euwallacea fornicatus]|uniref:uncharacterized protein Aven n=1 Tax=Euwallacea fornicatus TaxID=995702 RepID=UPI00338F48B0
MNKDEMKSRGLKHVKDKKKYKGNTTKNPKYVPPKNVPRLDSNWDRYERQEENEFENVLSASTDFALLANAPFSVGSHFQFKKDRVPEGPISEESSSDLFSLNLDLLNKSILTVPFYERLNISKEHFKAADLQSMDERAIQSKKAYKLFLDSLNHQQSAKVISPITNEDHRSDDTLLDAPTCEKLQKSSTAETPYANIKTTNSLMELIDNCSLEDTIDLDVPEDNNQSTDGLEQWLDYILDD